ncbi:hypothetical protein BpHYR1_014635 [Brachionus plicatilis]|uniref:Uncharacterized protein n=1 Tax=Brachionus plicatilis TaxID=10195 RepID=A0A3M7T7D0_BRAPC|nr:hypothetical protein BpHYR1_014635 [Brachionus plicatilis]
MSTCSLLSISFKLASLLVSRSRDEICFNANILPGLWYVFYILDTRMYIENKKIDLIEDIPIFNHCGHLKKNLKKIKNLFSKRLYELRKLNYLSKDDNRAETPFDSHSISD